MWVRVNRYLFVWLLPPGEQDCGLKEYGSEDHLEEMNRVGRIVAPEAKKVRMRCWLSRRSLPMTGEQLPVRIWCLEDLVALFIKNRQKIIGICVLTFLVGDEWWAQVNAVRRYLRSGSVICRLWFHWPTMKTEEHSHGTDPLQRGCCDAECDVVGWTVQPTEAMLEPTTKMAEYATIPGFCETECRHAGSWSMVVTVFNGEPENLPKSGKS